MQVEWFSEPKRQVSIADPWKEGTAWEPGACGWTLPSHARHALTATGSTAVRKLASVIGRGKWEACCPHRSLDSSLLDHFSLVTNPRTSNSFASQHTR